jgi:hypothetical protein
MNAFHSGCIGDIIYSIPTLKELDVKKLFVGNRPWTKPIEHRIPAFKRLVEEQGISVHKHEGENIDFDLSTYRNGGMRYGENIASRVARWMLAKPDLDKPWLSVQYPNPYTKGKIVISRGARWHGEYFPWKQIVEEFKDDLVFVGLPEEHHAFCSLFGNVEYLPTIDLYAVAEAIAGSDLFIGNQSSPNAICEGLKHDCIQECCLYAFDCVFVRNNKQHITHGELSFTHGTRSFNASPSYPKQGHKIVFNNYEYKAKEPHLVVAMLRADLILQGQSYSVEEMNSWVERY